jgi:hypothetical protein
VAIALADLWVAAGVLLGLQGATFAHRVHREIAVADEGDPTWLPPADVANLASTIVMIVGVFILPAFGVGGLSLARYAFGLSALLFAGHLFAIAGHYELFNPKTSRSHVYFPVQERIAIGLVTVAAIAYVVSAVLR